MFHLNSQYFRSDRKNENLKNCKMLNPASVDLIAIGKLHDWNCHASNHIFGDRIAEREHAGHGV